MEDGQRDVSLTWKQVWLLLQLEQSEAISLACSPGPSSACLYLHLGMISRQGSSSHTGLLFLVFKILLQGQNLAAVLSQIKVYGGCWPLACPNS